MEITPPSPNLLNTVTLTRTTPEIRNWQVGQILQATVQQVQGEGLASLRIGTQTLLAQLQFPVLPGQKLSLEVTQLGDLPQLRAQLSAPLQKAIEQALLRSLPRQTEHNQLLANLHQASKPNTPVQLPPSVQQVVRNLYQSLPDVSQVSTPQGVKKAIQDSGIFLETRLAQAKFTPVHNLQSDFKANLLRLYRAITQNIPPAASDTRTEPTRQATPAGTGTATTPATPAAAPAPQVSIRPPTLSAPLPQAHPERVLQGNPAQTAKPATVPPSQAGELAKPLPQASNTASSPAPQGSDTAARTAGTPLPENLTAQRLLASTMASPSIQARSPQNMTGIANENTPIIPAFSLLNWKQPVPQARANPNLSFHESLFRLMTSLVKDAESSLARIQMNQLHSQRTDGGEQKPGWVFEIPVRRENGTDIFHFHVERDAEHRDKQEQRQDQWTVNMAFHLEELGAIHCRVMIWKQDVSVQFWATEPETTRLFNQHMAELHERLESNGLSVNKLSCLPGTPPPREDKPLQDTLLNEKV